MVKCVTGALKRIQKWWCGFFSTSCLTAFSRPWGRKHNVMESVWTVGSIFLWKASEKSTEQRWRFSAYCWSSYCQHVIHLRFYAKLVVLFMEIAKFTGSWPPLPNSSKVKAQKVAKESEKRGGIKRKKKQKPPNPNKHVRDVRCTWDCIIYCPRKPTKNRQSWWCWQLVLSLVLGVVGCSVWSKVILTKSLIWFCLPTVGMGEKGGPSVRGTACPTEAFVYRQDEGSIENVQLEGG